MSNYFPQEFIEQVRSASDIVSVVSEYVALKKKGKNYFGLCPFHAEKTPSFSVNSEKQIFHCFGCGQGGNAITFLMNHDKLGFVESVKYLAEKANLKLPARKSAGGELDANDLLYQAQQAAVMYFTANLSHSPRAEEVSAYLTGRNISPETCRFFQLGLATEEWDALLKFAPKKGSDTQTLKRAGLIAERNDKKGFYDLLRKRLIFPIFNLSGKVVALAGRVLDPQDNPKYLNLSESPIYQKGKLLYGLNFSKDKIRDKGTAIIVEGYMDFISLYQAGIQNLVASCGTAFTADQARLLSRFAREAVLLFDADNAGQMAALRSVDALYDAGLEVRVARLPQGSDPDSFVNKFGSAELNNLIAQAVSFVQFKASFLKGGFDKLNIREQEQSLVEFARTASRINDRLRRGLFLRQVSDELGISEGLLSQAVRKFASSEKKEVKVKAEESRPEPEVWEKEFLAFVTENPVTLKTAGDTVRPEDFLLPARSELWKEIVQEYAARGEIDLSLLLEKSKEEAGRKLLLELAGYNFDEIDKEKQLQDYLQKFQNRKMKNEVTRLKELLKKAEKDKDQKTANTIALKIQKALKDNELAVKN